MTDINDFADKIGVTGDDLRSYRDVAAAFPPDKRNPANSWEVHAMLKDHPNKFALINKRWTEASLAEYLAKPKTMRELIEEAGESEREEVNSIMLDMEAEGLVKPNPDGTITVTGTKEQLMRYGMDPTDPSIFDRRSHPTSIASRVPNNPFGIKGMKAPVPERHVDASQDMIDKYMTEYSRKGHKGDDLVMVHGAPGESPMMFPRDVLAKARAAGEVLVEFTEAEMKAWRKKEGDKASVRFVLDFDDKTTTSVTKDALDEAWRRTNGELRATEDKISMLTTEISALDTKVASAASRLLAATQDPETPGWTMLELTEHLNLDEKRTSEIIEGMVEAGHVDIYTRSNGEKAYRLNTAGRSIYESTFQFDEDDPRLNSKQWFADCNASDLWRRR
jgi:predicted transcriptional regulator